MTSSSATVLPLPPPCSEEATTAHLRRLFWLCGLAWGFGGVAWFTATQFLVFAVGGKWGLPLSARGIYASAFNSGMVFGAPIFGRLSDQKGRRPALLLSMATSSLMAVMSGIAGSWQWLLIFQFMQGIGVGGTLPLPNLLFSECSPANGRGRYMTLLGTFCPMACICTAGLAWLLLGRHVDKLLDPVDEQWRVFYCACGVALALLTLLLGCVLPESARFVRVSFSSTRLSETASSLWDASGQSVSFKCQTVLPHLLGPRTRTTTLLLWAIWFGGAFGANGFNTLLPELMKAKGVLRERLYQDIFIYAIAGVPGIIVASISIETSFGRRRTLQFAWLLTAASIILFASTQCEWQLVLYSCIFNMVSNAAWVALFTYTPEMYATEIRSQGTAAAHVLHNLAGIIAPSLGVWLVHTQGPYRSLVVMSAAPLLSAVSACFLPQEMRCQALLDRMDE